MADQELGKILEELKTIHKNAKHFRVKNLLSEEILKVEGEIVSKQKKAVPKTEVSSERRRQVELFDHAFDESEKFVKIFIPFAKSKISDENVHIEFTSTTSFNVIIKVDDHGSTDYKFSATNLLKPLNIESSYIKVKSQDKMIALYLKKEKEGTKWECLTTTEKRLKESKSKALENDKEESKEEDPMGGLMNIMKKMYDSGDSEMKRTIAKVWTEGQEKSKQNPMF